MESNIKDLQQVCYREKNSLIISICRLIFSHCQLNKLPIVSKKIKKIFKKNFATELGNLKLETIGAYAVLCCPFL
jgi:hypothetical protein